MYKKLFYISLIILGSHSLFAQKNKVKKHSKASTPLHKVVLHLTSNDTLVWAGLMNNIKNLKAGWGDSVLIEVVTNGMGVQMLMKDKTTQQQKISDFKSKGIVFYACENTMKQKNISKDAIISQAQFVPMGIGEVIKKQELGWSYVKAGN